MALLESQTMAAGSPIPAFNLKDAHGRDFDSSELEQAKLALIVFTCNHCPYAIASWPVMVDLYNKYKSEGLVVVGINPNNNPDYPEDAFDKMAAFAKANAVEFPYLFDANQQVARAFNAVCTPDPFLFLEGKLFYHGRFNDNWQNPAAVKEHSMELYIQAGLNKISRPEQQYPSMGCSIKWNQN